MKKVFLVGALMFSMLLISCPNTKEKPSIPKVNTTKVKSNNAITLTIENATESTIARINIKTTKKLRFYFIIITKNVIISIIIISSSMRFLNFAILGGRKNAVCQAKGKI